MKSILVLSVVLAAARAFPADEVTSGIQHRIAGGDEAAPNQFPYQVGMKLTKVRNGKEILTWCGGSLISNKVVLTAAHCLYQAKSAVVFLGAHNRRAIREEGRLLIDVAPEDMIIHEEYDTIFTENDIALIILKTEVPLSQSIQTVRLPALSEKDESYFGSEGVISGWGRTGDGPNDSASTVLRFVHRVIRSNQFCSFYFPMFKSTQICVDGSKQKSACAGDSGGPLVVENAKGEKTLVGLTSYGRAEGCQKNFPISYTRVSSYLSWISAKTGINILP